MTWSFGFLPINQGQWSTEAPPESEKATETLTEKESVLSGRSLRMLAGKVPDSDRTDLLF